MAFSPLPALSVACAALAAMCGPAGGDSSGLQTQSYLGGAVDPNHLFYWTPRTPGAPTEVFVEVQNALHELPEALRNLDYGPAECAAAVRQGFEAWTRHTGVPMALTLSLHDAGETVAQDLVKVEVLFREGAEPGLVGYTTLHTLPLQPAVVQRVSVEVLVGPIGPHVNAEAVYALLLHEFGHALGIVAPAPRTGHSTDDEDVMYPTVRWSDLSAEDRLAMRELYALKPTMRRADEGAGGPSAPEGPGGPPRTSLVSLLGLRKPMRSEPATVAPQVLRCGTCAR